MAAGIFAGTMDARLIALDANTGKPCPDFGEAGEIDAAIIGDDEAPVARELRAITASEDRHDDLGVSALGLDAAE